MAKQSPKQIPPKPKQSVKPKTENIKPKKQNSFYIPPSGDSGSQQWVIPKVQGSPIGGSTDPFFTMPNKVTVQKDPKGRTKPTPKFRIVHHTPEA